MPSASRCSAGAWRLSSGRTGDWFESYELSSSRFFRDQFDMTAWLARSSSPLGTTRQSAVCGDFSKTRELGIAAVSELGKLLKSALVLGLGGVEQPRIATATSVLSTRPSQPDDRTRGWSRAVFPTKSTKPNGTSAGEQNGYRAAEEPRLSGAAAAVPETSKAPIGGLFVPRSSEPMAERALRAGPP